MMKKQSSPNWLCPDLKFYNYETQNADLDLASTAVAIHLIQQEAPSHRTSKIIIAIYSKLE